MQSESGVMLTTLPLDGETAPLLPQAADQHMTRESVSSAKGVIEMPSRLELDQPLVPNDQLAVEFFDLQ